MSSSIKNVHRFQKIHDRKIKFLSTKNVHDIFSKYSKQFFGISIKNFNIK